MAYTRVIAGDDSSPEQMNVLYDSMEKLEAISAEATTLTPGSNATAEVQTDGSGNKKLVVGLPQGVTGSAGTNGANGKSYRPMGVWSSTPTYINDSQYIDTVLGADGNQYYCKVSNTNVSTSNTTYWGLLAQKGADGTGAGNIYGNNITAADGIVTTKTYGIQPTAPLPAEGGTLAGNLVEVAATEDMNKKVEKDFTNVYAEKTTLVNDDLIIIQDSADTSSPKLNKKVKISSLKTVKVNSAIMADSASQAPNLSQAINNTSIANTAYVRQAISDVESNNPYHLVYSGTLGAAAVLNLYTALGSTVGKQYKIGVYGNGKFYFRLGSATYGTCINLNPMTNEIINIDANYSTMFDMVDGVSMNKLVSLYMYDYDSGRTTIYAEGTDDASGTQSIRRQLINVASSVSRYLYASAACTIKIWIEG